MNTEELMKLADAYAQTHPVYLREGSTRHDARASLEATLSAKQERISELEAKNAQLLGVLKKIATVNAMDYEYQRWAKAAIAAADTGATEMNSEELMKLADAYGLCAQGIARKELNEARAAIEAAPSAKQEPDWTDSETGLLECWKNRLHPMSDRLLMADGAIAFRDKIIANLRSQLASLSNKQGEGMSNALELAAIFDDELKWQTTPISRTEVAAELRRLHEQNAQLLEALRYFMSAVENSSHLDARRGIMAGAFDIAHAVIATTERKK